MQLREKKSLCYCYKYIENSKIALIRLKEQNYTRVIQFKGYTANYVNVFLYFGAKRIIRITFENGQFTNERNVIYSTSSVMISEKSSSFEAVSLGLSHFKN